jgi:CYTH domain-containing protein
MPIENERKYVLLPKNDLGLMTDLELLGTTTVDKIEQGYLPGNARIRSIVNKYEYSYKSPDSDEWIEPATNLKFTYKLQIGTDLVEIETDLSQADYNRLIMVARNKIVKTRISVPEGDLTWEVDFFHDFYNANLYLIMAEVELPEGVDTPETIPAYITDNLLYAVERHDRRFDNANLSDADAVRATVAHIKYEIENPSISLEEYERNVNQSAQNNG